MLAAGSVAAPIDRQVTSCFDVSLMGLGLYFETIKFKGLDDFYHLFIRNDLYLPVLIGLISFFTTPSLL